jgi:hypothetical protein
MSAICDLPTVPLVVSTLSGLLGRQTTVSKADVTEHSAPHLVVEYHMNPGDHLGAAFVIDLEFAALLGGALALIPAGGVKEMVAENDIGEGCLDAMREVLHLRVDGRRVPLSSNLDLRTRGRHPRRDDVADELGAA